MAAYEIIKQTTINMLCKLKLDTWFYVKTYSPFKDKSLPVHDSKNLTFI